MDISTAILLGTVLFVVGVMLLFVSHILQLYRENYRLKRLSGMLKHEVKSAVITTLKEGMDIIPEKVLEVKKTIDEGG